MPTASQSWKPLTADGDSTRCLVGCGSYVAGDRGPLQKWSSSEFAVKDGLAFIRTPEDAWEITTTQAVALPYYIPSSNMLTQIQLEAYENRCLHELQLRLLQAKIHHKPFKAIFLELVLAGNGSSLSDRFLSYLATLARHHHLNIVVDEVLTAARASSTSMLLTLDKPNSFIQRVSHVTVGKWTQCGLVLRNVSYVERMSEFSRFNERGVSTLIETKEANWLWQTAYERRSLVSLHRSQVIQQLAGIDESECWGPEIMIYTPCRRSDSLAGLKNRFLPMLETNLRVEKIRKTFQRKHWSKQKICWKVVGGVTQWIKFVPHTEYLSLTSRLVTEQLVRPKYVLDRFAGMDIIEELNVQIKAKQVSRVDIQECLNRLEKQGIVQHGKKGKKRIRRYELVSSEWPVENFILQNEEDEDDEDDTAH